ncbi:hypothetical protein V8J82_10530 [Gymnodinialimonas sp. 2305UL16-5]|uniref:hypothetical protein n=1 Tax=Gymnodinialimonas mytili TaxID=3126503 RepID=UPI0030AF62A1
MSLRPIALVLALASAGALPIQAEPLPEGSYILGTYIWGDTHVPRYVTLLVEGDEVSVEFASAGPLAYLACIEERQCHDRIIAAHADVGLQDGALHLSNVDIAAGADAAIDDSPNALPYVEPLLAGLDGAAYTQTAEGFRLSTGQGIWDFYEADAPTRDAIRVYAYATNLSISQMAGCEVRQLAQMFMAPDPGADVTRFQNALMGMTYMTALNLELTGLGEASQDPDDSDAALRREVLLRLALPRLLMGPDTEDPFETRLTAVLAAPPFETWDMTNDEVNALYGGHLDAFVAFQAHIDANPGLLTAASACRDPSFGFIAPR